MGFRMCKNGCSGLDRKQHGKLEDNVDVKPGSTWYSRHHQKTNLSRRQIITITVCGHHHDTTVTDSKGYKSWLKTEESSLWMIEAIWKE